MVKIIDGKLVSATIKEDLKKTVQAFIEKTGVQPTLATILVGADPASQIYIKNKIKFTQNCGMQSLHFNLPAETTQDQLLQKIKELNEDQKVHGVLVQLPLPPSIEENKIIAAIHPQKDVDGFHPYNTGLLMAGQPSLQPCTPLGVMQLLKFYEIELTGKNVVIIGRSNIVGKPQAMMMLQANATITICHSKTQNLKEKVQAADVVVAAIGKPKFIQADWIKTEAVVIDVGINRDQDKKLCGDVDFETVKEKASYITPVPGGVGPMTIAMLLQNTLIAAKNIVQGGQ